jgi:hypothetical protein
LTVIACTATTVMVLSLMDALGLAGGVEEDNNNNGASPDKGGSERAGANKSSVNHKIVTNQLSAVAVARGEDDSNLTISHERVLEGECPSASLPTIKI